MTAVVTANLYAGEDRGPTLQVRAEVCRSGFLVESGIQITRATPSERGSSPVCERKAVRLVESMASRAIGASPG